MNDLKQLTLARAKKLNYGDIIYEKGKYNTDGTHRRCRVSGKVKTWKRNKNRVKIPIKHGLDSYGYVTEDNINLFLIERG